ncbi:MAG: response regulator [Deltaproteobacteria bacterium]
MNQTVLIADGDAELCDIYQRYFTVHGYDVETSLDGVDCLERLRQLEPAVLVLDQALRWGRADGVLAWLRDESLMPRIPVILMTTGGYLQDFSEFLGLPIVDCLPKPFALTVLLEKVRSAVAKQGRREPPELNRNGHGAVDQMKRMTFPCPSPLLS